MKYVQRKTFKIRKSGRSSDYITPSFGYGCLYKCTYCYMRRNIPYGLSVAENIDDILTVIDAHANDLLWPKPPNQTSNDYWTYDFSCNEDFILHTRFYDWEYIFDFFRDHDRIMGTAATKYVNDKILTYNADKKIRIRFSLMPQEISTVLEPNTSKIIDRIHAVNRFYDAGYDVHLNYSPIVVYKNSKQGYTELFKLVNDNIRNDIKENVMAECIFLTHNEKLHNYNVENNVMGEDLLWTPHNQQEKTSIYGGKNIRYKYWLKNEYITAFKRLHNSILPWQKIRYIF
jgi:spore photoproduct lyase